MGSGRGYICPHCGEQIDFCFGVGMRFFDFDHNEELFQEIIKGEYGDQHRLELLSLLEKFYKPNTYASGKEADTRIITVHGNIKDDEYYQCSKCHNLQRKNTIFMDVDDGLLRFSISFKDDYCEECRGNLQPIEWVFDKESDDEYRDDYENGFPAFFICPECHKEITAEELKKQPVVIDILWD